MAAGLGFKNFTTGEVLTAGDVNGYLMQGVLVFASAAARTAAITSPQEGQVSFLKDTNSTEYYSGSAWVAVGGSVPASLEYSAGKNAIINGDFYVNQRNFSSTAVSDTYGFDRWLIQSNTGTTTYSAQTFTLGTAPVTGYEGKNFARVVTSGQTAADAYSHLVQRIENVRTFANQTVTVSFWAKAAAGTPKVSIEFNQFFGTGGSPSATARNNMGQVTLSTSWARYSVTASVASISGKTLGTANDNWLGLYLWTSAGTDFNARTNSLGIQSATIDFWGVQVEEGSTLTSFQTATGTIEGELAVCERYYWRHTTNASANTTVTIGTAYSATAIYAPIRFPITMRISPTSMETANLQSNDGVGSATINTITFVNANPDGALLNATSLSAGVTQYRPYLILATPNGYVAFNAEL